MKPSLALATLSLVGLVGMPALSQTLQERIDGLKDTVSNGVGEDNSVYTQTQEPVRATPQQLMRQTISMVDFDALPGRLALEAWSNQTGVPLVVNWSALEAEGVNPEVLITLRLRHVPADQVLKLLVKQLHPDPIGDDALIIDVEPWYVRVITKRDALRQSVTKLYFIGDLLMEVPNFTQAPGFDLNEALNNTNSGGSNGGGGNNGGGQNNIFGDDNDNQNEEAVLTKEEKAEQLADVLRNGIEPDIWEANGGEYASMRYYRGMLVVKAPEFVHEQIGIPVVDISAKQTSLAGRNDRDRSDSTASQPSNQNQRRRSTSGNVAGTAGSGPRLVR